MIASLRFALRNPLRLCSDATLGFASLRFALALIHVVIASLLVTLVRCEDRCAALRLCKWKDQRIGSLRLLL
jgi:hypothetical protein